MKPTVLMNEPKAALIIFYCNPFSGKVFAKCLFLEGLQRNTKKRSHIRKREKREKNAFLPEKRP